MTRHISVIRLTDSAPTASFLRASAALSEQAVGAFNGGTVLVLALLLPRCEFVGHPCAPDD